MALDTDLLRRLWYRNNVISPEEIADSQHLAAIRYDTRNFSYKRPLIDWTLSHDWTVPREVIGKRRGLQVTGYGSNPKGMVTMCDECSGEIIAR